MNLGAFRISREREIEVRPLRKVERPGESGGFVIGEAHADSPDMIQ